VFFHAVSYAIGRTIPAQSKIREKKDFAAKERRERKEGELELQSKASGGVRAVAIPWRQLFPLRLLE
jgi:hypothetical protein